MKAAYKSTAFSLIELLVVVSILLILAGLGVDRLAAALERAKVARVKSDLRIIATAIEAYAVDLNSYPRMRHYGMYKDPNLDIISGQQVNGVLSPVLSTPVAYISSVMFIDPHMQAENLAPLDQRLYTYQELGAYRKHFPKSELWMAAYDFYGPYRLGSVGPDLNYDNNATRLGPQIPYDPTNGIVSSGNIWRSEKFPEASLPKDPRLF